MKRNSEKDDLVGRLAARHASQAGSAAPAGCPEPELLAAYVDGALAGDEVARSEQHFAACASCRQTLAEMARGAEASSGADARAVVERARMWSWRWLVPAAATLAVAALWIVLRPAPLPRHSTSVPTERMARADEVTTQPTQVSPTSRELEAAPKGAAAAAPPAAAPKRQAADDAAAGSGRPAERRRAAERSETPAFAAAEPAAPDQAPAAAMPRKEMVAENMAKAEAPKDVAQAKPVRPSAEREGVAGAVVSADRVAAAPAPAALGEADKSGQLARVAVENRPIVIRTPEPSVLWRLGPAGSIQRSTDGGRAWTPQLSGVTFTFVAGSAPTPLVCWAVGQRGTILRTIDGGTWEAVASPTSLDLVAVVARDALTATIVASDGQTWVTTDAGGSWRRRE